MIAAVAARPTARYNGAMTTPARALTTTPAPDRDQPFVGWYQLPESYSLPLVQDYMARYDVGPGQTVLGPFAGAGTTLLAAKLAGVNAVGLEVNPFLSWAAGIKTRFEYDLP